MLLQPRVRKPFRERWPQGKGFGYQRWKEQGRRMVLSVVMGEVQERRS